MRTPSEPSWSVMRKLLWASFRDKWRGFRGQERISVKAFGAPGEVAFMSGEDALPAMRTLVPEGSGYANRVAAGILLDVDEYRPVNEAEKVACPALLVLAEDDLYVSNEAAEETSRRMPRAEMLLLDLRHFDVYTGDGLEQAVKAEAEFLSRHLLGED